MKLFGTTSSGQEVQKITLTAGDLTVSLLTWGAIVQDVRLASVGQSLTLGSEDIADYEGALRHHGALIGPIANRISNARVRLDGMMHELERNQDGRIHLHSGAQATHLRLWDIVDFTPEAATLSLTLRDGECGLPGNRKIKVRFEVKAPATLTMTITGTTDETTLMNFANHAYWNLDGSHRFDGHMLQVAADHYLPTTDDFTPTGDIADVTGTPMDFRQARRVEAMSPELDHNFCLSDSDQPLRDFLTLVGTTGVQMTMATTAPGLQIYDGRAPARPGKDIYEGLVFEAQGWPDAPNHPDFPSIKITPDETYHQTTSWRFKA